ncbi:MAG: hypothetical protein EBQ78_00940, partial [Betaproteobacteria bacterium]|nr:hypothetical protein [Betaproteobacteria bacterium]
FQPGQGINIFDQVRASACQWYVFTYGSFKQEETQCKVNENRSDFSGDYYGYAYESSPRVKIEPASPIAVAGNVIGGSGVNLTSNLASQGGTKLLPQFIGGTLTVSAPATIADNFTLGTSQSNAIDSAGRLFFLKGILSDEITGQAGNIKIINTATVPSASAVFFQGTNTYTGLTTVESGVLALQGIGSIVPSSRVDVLKGASFDVSSLDFPYTAIQNLSGEGNVALGATTLILNNAQGGFNGAIKDSDVIIPANQAAALTNRAQGYGPWEG